MMMIHIYIIPFIKFIFVDICNLTYIYTLTFNIQYISEEEEKKPYILKINNKHIKNINI